MVKAAEVPSFLQLAVTMCEIHLTTYHEYIKDIHFFFVLFNGLAFDHLVLASWLINAILYTIHC